MKWGIFIKNLAFIVLIFLLCSCSKAPEAKIYPIEYNNEQAKFDYTIGFVSSWGSTELADIIYKDVKEKIKDYPMFEIKYFDSFLDNQKQIDQIQNFIKSGVDLLIVIPGDSNILNGVISEAKNDDIPIIMLGAKTNSENYDQYVGVDNYQLGYSAGKYISEKILDRGGRILEIQGTTTSSIASELKDGLSEGVLDAGNIQIVSHSANWNKDITRNVVNQVFSEDQKFDLVVCHNDEMTLSAIEIAKNNGLNNLLFASLNSYDDTETKSKLLAEKNFVFAYTLSTGVEEALKSAHDILVKNEKVQKNLYISPKFDRYE